MAQYRDEFSAVTGGSMRAHFLCMHTKQNSVPACANVMPAKKGYANTVAQKMLESLVKSGIAIVVPASSL